MTKEHKKLYKKGKLWLTATILALAWGIAAGCGTAAADTNNNQPAVTATVNQPAAGAASNLSTPANNQTAPTPSTNYDHQDQGNYASLDSVKLNNLGEVEVSGWHATNASVDRPFPAIYDSDHSGFQIGFTIPDQMQHHVVRIIHRYSNDAGGNGQYTDYWSGPVDVNSYAQRLIAAWSQIINNFGAPVDIAIQMPATGQVISWTNAPNHQFITASSVKLSILSLLLHNTGGNLNGYQQDLAQRMIRYSDNNATSTITASYLGGNAGVNNIFHALGMNSSYTGEHWGWTLTTASDQLKLLNEIFLKPHSDYLNDGSRNYIKYLMNTVSPAQNWGISAGSGNFYIKDGWNYIDNPYAWNVSSIGYIPDKYTIAIYTEGRPLANARTVIEQLARVTRSIVG